MTARWHDRVRRHAAQAGVDLPPETIAELAQHLDDAHTAALRDGADAREAEAIADRLLDESAFDVLDRHRRLAERRPSVQNAHDTAAIARPGPRSYAMFHAVRMAIRQFSQHRTFTVMTVLVLGLGTGAAAAVFTIVDAVVLRPLPYRAPDELVTIWDTNAEKALAHERNSPVNFMDERALPAFSAAAAWWRPDLGLTEPGQEPVRVKGVETSANLFAVLGVKAALGPGFPDDGPFFSKDLIAVISDRLWRSRYHADEAIVGKQIRLNDGLYTIAGVMPPRFTYPGDIDVWMRLTWDLTQHSRAAHFMEAVARLAPGVSVAQAQVQLQTLGLRLGAANPSSNRGWSARLVPLLDDQLGYYRPALIVLFGAVGLLLVIGCLNVASLLLTRALSREREVAVRVALGATPRQLLTQMLAEGLVLSVAGAAAGLLAAMLAIPAIVHATPVHIPRLEETSVNLSALGAALGVILATTIFFGLVPGIVLLKKQIGSDLRAGGRGTTRGARRIYQVLVAGEVALACALLISSALLVRTVQRMADVSTGVDADAAVIATVQLASTAYPQWPQVVEGHAAILERVRREPAISAAGAGVFLPMEAGWRLPFSIDGQPPPARPEDAPQVQHETVTDGFFETFGARLSAGRFFSRQDTTTTPPVVVVNELFAKRYLPSNPVGARLHTSARNIGPLGMNLLAGQSFEVIGVVADVRNAPIGQPIEPCIYFATQQFPFRTVKLLVRGADAARAIAAVKTALKDVAPSVVLGDVETWGAHVRTLTAEPRLLMTVLVFFGSLASILAAIGVYGLFSWAVAVRTRELAIRLTLGARPSKIGGLVVRQSLVLVGVGLVAGWAIVRLSEGLLSRVLFDVKAADLGPTLLASTVLLAAAMIAGAVPAWRAASTDPAEALRGE